MKVHVYEKFWMGTAVAIIAAFAAAVVLTAYGMGIHPPSHVETIDPATVESDPRFAHRGVGVERGRTVVTMVLRMWSFDPAELSVPAGVPVTFRLTSPDVIHGFEIVGTNVNAMVVPGYVSQVTTTFPRAGDYLIVCHEYCGVGHHLMQAAIKVAGGGS